MSAPTHAAAWNDLPLELQQRILVLAGSPCARRVSKACRDAFDAANDTLCLTSFPDAPYSGQNLEVAATAAATRVIKRSANLTAINLVDDYDITSPPHTLLDLLAAGAASGLAIRLRKLTGTKLEAACAAEQLQALRQCTGLTHLDISSSVLQECQAVELATAIQELQSLTCLRFSCCETRGDEVSLASALQHLTQLQHLHLARNRMGAPALAALAPALSAMPKLHTLVVSANYQQVLQWPDWVDALCALQLLSVVPGLTHLNVGRSHLHEGLSALLAAVLQGMTRLQHLDLSHNHLGKGMAALAPALAALPNLHTLDLSSCGLQDELSSLQPLLASASSPLRKLALCDNLLSLGDAQALAAGLSAAPQLQELDLQRVMMRLQLRDEKDEGWLTLAAGFSCLGPSLQALKLGSFRRCDFSAALSADLAAALKPLTGLTRLEAISLYAALETIFPALMGMRRLQVLNLYGSTMRAKGTAAFVRVLPALSGSLTHLTLSECFIGDEPGAVALAPALAQATGLVELHMHWNSFGPRGGQLLPPVLAALPHLRKVDLSACGLDAQGCMAIVRALKDRDGMLVRLGSNCKDLTSGSAEGSALCSTPGICVLL